ncbi:phage terminase large subunit [Rickettsia bellii]|uniref:Terminase-like family protein n=1 Tax=Rickettsia bellii str. RML An4 TaxID=1359193 RepID=A0A0F3QD34_RICBE|nr:phage terminase large subunit [Rickettsia bellii]KJV90046.1 terminase-like family protein [Rickettsia bellii str. RML An4]
MIYSKELLNSVLRQDFPSFIIKVFNTINPGAKYYPSKHINIISDYLRAVQNGDINRLIINIPPRSLKSICVSVAWTAFLLGLDPAKRIMLASYSQMLSVKHSLDCRFILNSDWYKELFPNTILSKTHNQKSKFLTTANGFRFATSVGGSATGEGGDILIIDDPHNPTQIHSYKIRQKVIDWFEQTFVSRLNNRNRGAIVLVMQRLHSDDLAGYLLNSSNGWHHLKIPAIADCDYSFKLTANSYVKGEVLENYKEPADCLAKLEHEIGSYNYHAQYLQEPIPQGSSLLNMEDISFYENLPEKFDYLVQSWDTAIKISEDSDYSVCTIWGILGQKYYLISLVRKKINYPELKNLIEKLANQYKPRFILIEDKASGQQLIQDLGFLGDNIRVVGIKPKLDKITRFASVVPLFQAGIVLMPRQSTIALKELLNFPHIKNDDIVDSVSQFLNFMKEKSLKLPARIRSIII